MKFPPEKLSVRGLSSPACVFRWKPITHFQSHADHWPQRPQEWTGADHLIKAWKVRLGHPRYGLAVFGSGFTGTPNVGFGLSDGRLRDYRFAWRLTPAASGDTGFEVSLDALIQDLDIADQFVAAFQSTLPCGPQPDCPGSRRAGRMRRGCRCECLRNPHYFYQYIHTIITIIVLEREPVSSACPIHDTGWGGSRCDPRDRTRRTSAKLPRLGPNGMTCARPGRASRPPRHRQSSSRVYRGASDGLTPAPGALAAPRSSPPLRCCSARSRCSRLRRRGRRARRVQRLSRRWTMRRRTARARSGATRRREGGLHRNLRPLPSALISTLLAGH